MTGVQDAANAFMAGLHERVHPWPVDPDGRVCCVQGAIGAAWGCFGGVDYAEEIKVYTDSPQPGMSSGQSGE
jgi:hypothetical protein